jgi:tRNA-specific 2-thiouridylase
LKKAKDRKKDQSYFLYRLNQFQLRHTLFPLGDYTKEEVRALAREFDLPVADKAASQEICFLPGDDYRAFLHSRMASRIVPGDIIGPGGEVAGRHKGAAFYTIGQREGLGVALGYPAYVCAIDARRNRVYLGGKREAQSREFIAGSAHFCFRRLKKKVALKVRIRYNHKEEPATITPQASRLQIRFNKPQFAVCPGQSAVIYDKDTVIGGGVIERILS